MSDEISVRFTISPEGVASLYLARVKASATIEDINDLVELFKMFYNRGQEDSTQLLDQPEQTDE